LARTGRVHARDNVTILRFRDYGGKIPIFRLSSAKKMDPTVFRAIVFMQQSSPAGIRDADHPRWKSL